MPEIQNSDGNRKINVYAFEDALVLSGFGRFNLLFTLLCGLIAISLILETLAFSFIISASQCDMHLSITDKGILGAVPLIGLISTSQIWGYVADTRGRKSILISTMLATTFCAIISSFTPNMTVMIVLKLISTAFVSAPNAILFTYFGEMMPKTHVDMMISILCSVFGVGSIVATGISWCILPLDFNIPLPLIDMTYRPWRLLIVCFALPLLLSSLGMYYAPESPKYLMSLGKKDEVLDILRMIYVVNTGNHVSTYQVEDLRIDEQDKVTNSVDKESTLACIWSQIAPIFRPPLLIYSFITFTVAFGTIGNVNPFFMWFPDLIDRFYTAIEHNVTENKTFCEVLNVRDDIRNNIMQNETNITQLCDDTFNPSSYPFMLFINTFLTTANIVVAIFLKWTTKKVVLISLLSISFLGVLLLQFVRNVYVSWLLILLYQCCGPILGIINAYIVELFPTYYRAMASSFMLMFGRFGGIISTNIFGLLIENNCSLNYYISGAMLLLCTLISLLLPATRRKVKEYNNSV